MPEVPKCAPFLLVFGEGKPKGKRATSTKLCAFLAGFWRREAKKKAAWLFFGLNQGVFSATPRRFVGLTRYRAAWERHMRGLMLSSGVSATWMYESHVLQINLGTSCEQTHTHTYAQARACMRTCIYTCNSMLCFTLHCNRCQCIACHWWHVLGI